MRFTFLAFGHLEERNKNLSQLVADRASFRSGSPSSDVGGFSGVDDVVDRFRDADRLDVLGEGDFSIELEKRDIVGELVRCAVFGVHVDFTDFVNDFSSLVGVTVVVSSDLDSKGIWLISVSVNTVSGTHDPVLVNDGSTTTKIAGSGSIVHAHLDLPWPTVWDSYLSTDDSGLIWGDRGVSTIRGLWSNSALGTYISH